MRIAVIDLGTNTFNLLIADIFYKKFVTVCNTKESVKIGKGGIHENIILPDAFDRALFALQKHTKAIKEFGAQEIIAIGTSALRTAKNAPQFLKEVKERFGIDIQIISGDREAELIYHGVKMSVEELSEPFLILDIGGGSNEFILANKESLLWKRSFPLGMARLNEKFKPSDPVTLQDISSLEKYFDSVLHPLIDFVRLNPIKHLVGAEGAFETFYNSIYLQSNVSLDFNLRDKARRIDRKSFFDFHSKLIGSTSEERAKIRGIEAYRIEMVVPASIFVNYIVRKFAVEHIWVSGFSLKEGVVYEKMKKLE